MNQPEFVDTPAKTYMSEQEFIAHMDELIPTPSVETNNNLLDLANSLWWEMKDDLYHAFSFVSRHFTTESLQSVYDLCGARKAGLLPWEIIGAAIYSQTGTPPETISTDEMRAFVLLPEPETAGTVSTLAACTVRENGQETLFYTLHFGQIDPQKLLDTAMARASESGTTVKEALQQTDYDLPEVESHAMVNKAILGPGSKLAEKLSQLMASSPTSLTVSDLKNADYDDPRWMDLVSQLSVSDATRLVRLGGYSTIGIESIGLPATQDKDGPSGISGTLVGGTSCMAWPAEVVFASTWNVELIERVGEAIGDDSIQAEVAGWYAPGVNIHRSPYSGRNFEYYSEDGFLSGMIGAAEMRGVRTKGVIAYMKHFALNDQETNRYGGAIFANEQAIREVFLKGFEYVVRDGGTVAAMASMNRLGPRWTGAHEGLVKATLRGEWGFQGMVITDQASVESMFYQDMISGLWAGTDLWLNTNTRFWSLKDYQSNATAMANVQNSAKNIIYAVAKSNAMGVSGTVAAEGTPLWRIGLIALDVVVFGACAAGVIITTIKLVKRKKA